MYIKPLTGAYYPDLYNLLDGDTWIEPRMCAFKIKNGVDEEFKYLFNKYLGKYFVLKSKKEIIREKLFGIGKDNKYFTHTKKQYQRAIDYNELINSFSFYSGLMPIVFECNKSNVDYPININPHQITAYPGDALDIYSYDTEPEFIEALQECIIKYLEVKNGIWNR